MVGMSLLDAPQRVIDEPGFIDGGDATLAAMWSLPQGTAARTGVVLLSAGGHVVHSQTNRWGYRVARAIASEGFPVLRFDYAGTGDSTGMADTFALDDPNAADTAAAVDAMAGLADRILMIGHCYGARSAFEVAADRDEVVGVYAIAPPVRDGARGEGTGSRLAYEASLAGYVGHAVKAFRPRELATREGRRRYIRLARTFVTARWRRVQRHLPRAYEDPTPWVSDRLIRQLQALGRRRVPVLFSYGSADSDYADFTKARAGRLGALMTKGKMVEVSTREGEVHNMARVDLQSEMIDEMVRWVLAKAEGTGGQRNQDDGPANGGPHGGESR
jgi:pimeloyl-ACP methyl ester carboxylesterase